MSDPVVIQISDAEVKFGPAPAAGTPVDPALLTVSYACQVTRAEITSSSNTQSTPRAATFCVPAAETVVPVASTFTLNLDWFQDWTAAAASGLSAFMFKNDATKQAFAIYVDGSADPVASGIVNVVAGGFGGTPGQPLTASVQMTIDGYPDITDSAGVSIRNPVVLAASAPGGSDVADDAA